MLIKYMHWEAGESNFAEFSLKFNLINWLIEWLFLRERERAGKGAEGEGKRENLEQTHDECEAQSEALSSDSKIMTWVEMMLNNLS